MLCIKTAKRSRKVREQPYMVQLLANSQLLVIKTHFHHL